MSKTFKTRPWDVRLLDKRETKVGIEEQHDHTKGYCDIPERTPQALRAQHESPDFAGSRSCTFSFRYKGVGICGCPLCTGQFNRKSVRRSARHKDAAFTKSVKKMVYDTTDVEDIDTPTPDFLAGAGKW